MAEPGSPSPSELVFYQGEDGRSRIQVRLDGGTVWLTQRLLAELFQKDVRTVNEHLQNIFEEGEADPAATIRKFRIVQTEGTREVSRLVDHYNLDVILAVGYRVRSRRGTQFRRWARGPGAGGRWLSRAAGQPGTLAVRRRADRLPGAHEGH